MASPPDLLDGLPAMQELAQAAAAGDCVWFIGSGLSYEAGLPSARSLTLDLLHRALAAADSPWDGDGRRVLWERLKRLLIGPHYHRDSPLTEQTTPAGILAELHQVETALTADRKNIPLWADRLTQLGRVADVLQRSVPNRDEADIHLARLMGLEPGPPGTPSVWDNEPGLAHFLLALLIAEGCVSTLITTNYDQLLEQACQAVPVHLRVVARSEDLSPARDGGAKARYYKIHGCRGSYLAARRGSIADLKAACAALVVTDRQLQDWRADKWARDLVNAHLRERHFLFVGYSAYDAVLQETLNLIAEEIRDKLPVKLFVAPEVSLPFYQYSAIRDATYDPLAPPNLIEAYGESLLRLLYPKAVGHYFRFAVNKLTPPDYLGAHTHWRCDNQVALTEGWPVASRWLSEWAETVAKELVATLPTGASLAESKERLRRSPFAMMRLSQTGDDAYRPLQRDLEEYERLLRLFCRMLAVAFPDPTTLAKVLGRLPDLSEPTYELFGDGKLIHVAMISGGEGGGPVERVLQRLDEYFNRHSYLERTGTFAFLITVHLEDDQAERIIAEIKTRYGGGYHIELWNLSGVYVSAGGGGVV